LGYLLFSITSSIVPSVTKFAGKKNDAPFIILSVLVVMFFIQPYCAAFFYNVT